jgi:hypothetical protein
MHYKMREAANRGGLQIIPFGALRQFAPPSRDFFIGQPNGRIGRFLR